MFLKVDEPKIPLQRVTLDIKTALAAISTIVVGVVVTVGSLYAIASSLTNKMTQLELNWQKQSAESEKAWQTRILGVEERLRADIRDLEKNIPPREVRDKLEDFEHRLRALEAK